MATTTGLGVCSRVLRGRSRVPRRTWVCQRRSWMGFVPFARHFVVRERESPSPQELDFIDKDAMHPGGLQLTETVSESTVMAHVARGDHLGVVGLGDRGHDARLLVDIQTDGACAGLVPG